MIVKRLEPNRDSIAAFAFGVGLAFVVVACGLYLYYN